MFHLTREYPHKLLAIATVTQRILLITTTKKLVKCYEQYPYGSRKLKC